MKRTTTLTVGIWITAAAIAFVNTTCLAREFDHTHMLYDKVLKAHVTHGRVDYNALKVNSRPLNTYLATLATVTDATFKSWDEPRQLAFLINLYNATTLRLILNHYPVKSIKDIGSLFKGPWDQQIVRVFGNTITLNNLEHDILRKEYKEPRIHMVLVCAAKGCPTLRSEAYTSEQLNNQLDDQSRKYLTSPSGLMVKRTKRQALVSSIFKWYGKDFKSVRAFVEEHSGQKLDGLTIRYLSYDWSLNDKSEVKP